MEGVGAVIGSEIIMKYQNYNETPKCTCICCYTQIFQDRGAQ